MGKRPWAAKAGEIWPPSVSGEGWRITFRKGIFGDKAHNENEWNEIELDGLPYPIYVKLGQADNGEIVCTGLHIEIKDQEICASHFRLIPLRQLVATIAAHASRMGIEPAQGGKSVRAKPGPKGNPREFYLNVARMHRKAVASGERYPLQSIAKEMYVSVSTARRWIEGCRRMGLKLN